MFRVLKKVQKTALRVIVKAGRFSKSLRLVEYKGENMKTINPERRKFFTKLGFGALSAGVVNAIPFRLFAQSSAEKKHSEQKITIAINPLAVKRTNK